MTLHPWLQENLVCPLSRRPLSWTGESLKAPSGREYPVVQGVPVVLVPGVDQTHPAARASWKRAHDLVSEDHLFLDTVGVSQEERALARDLHAGGTDKVDPVVKVLVAATSGYSYKHLIGRLEEYPIPEIPIRAATKSETLLDVGCGWGRWCLSAAQKGFQPVGVDPSLGAVLAAKRVARDLNEDALFVVADARFLPFRTSVFDRVFSYSVFQHLSREAVNTSVKQLARVLRQGGTSTVQMANRAGLWNLFRRLQRGFRVPSGFDVRYWTIPELREVFGHIGPTNIEADCFFGLGLRDDDRDLMPVSVKIAMSASAFLVAASERVPPLRKLADSVLVRSYAG